MATLGAKTIAAQQALSDKYGIPTFNTTGGISTVPKSGKISGINVGTGSYKSSAALNAAVSQAVSKQSLGKIQAVFAPNAYKGKSVNPSAGTSNPPVLPSKSTLPNPTVLSQKTLDAQKALSDKYGIPTFTLKGEISTVPDLVNGKPNFSNIDVGRGIYRTEENFINAIVEKYKQPADTSILGSVGSFFSDLLGTGNQEEQAAQEQAIRDQLESVTTEQNQARLQNDTEGGGIGGASGISTPNDQPESFLDKLTKDPVKFTLLAGGVLLLLIGVVKKK